MKNDPGEDSLPSLLVSVNDLMKTDIKTTEDILKFRRIVGNTKNELRDSFKCSVMLDFSVVSAAFHYYKSNKCVQNVPMNTSTLSNDIFLSNHDLMKDTDCVQPIDSNNLEKALSSLQMDTDLISEWPKLNTEFLNLCDFFDEQIDSIDIPSNSMTFQEDKLNENDFSNTTIVNIERNNSNLKNLDSNSCESRTQWETPNESFQTKFVIPKHTISSNQHSTNIEEKNLMLQCFHNGYFPEELDYEPSDAGEEAKESNNEFCIHDVLKDEASAEFSNYCPNVGVSENSTLYNKLNQEDVPNEFTDMCIDQDLIGFFRNDFESVSGKSRLKNYERSFEYDDEDESESDNEHSFKRNSGRNKQDQETLQQCLIDSNISEVSHLRNINDAILYICEQCKSGNINEAIAIANKSIAVSAKDVQLKIFKELFINLINFIKSPEFLSDNVMISKSLEKTMKIFHEAKLFDSHLCSLILNECFGCDHTIKVGMKLFSFIQKIKVPLYRNTILSYIDIIILEEFPSLELILLMEYIRCVCNLPCPRALFCKVLEDFSKVEKNNLPVGFFRLCKFLCSVNSLEVDVTYLQSFIEFCIKNDCWTQIASFFQAWYKDGCLISCLAHSFLFQLDDVGMFYEKFAEEIFKNEDVSLYLMGIFGQMGVFLMLEVFSKNQYESAFQILFMLHKRNINYLELQACLYNAPSYLMSLPEFADTFVFPFTVAFAALDICLHLKRFRDGYRIFKSFSLNLSENMADKMKLKVRSQRFRYLLKLTQELFSIEPLILGLQAFHDICLAAKDFSLKEVEDFAEEVQIIYNRYLTHVINECQLYTALELFKYSEGQMKEIFIINPQVVRSLLVTFAQNDMMEEAYKLFSLGCIRKVYNVEQTKMEENVWHLIIMSSWEIFEVEFLIKTFIKNISLSWNNENKTGFDRQLSVQILFEESKEDCLEMSCLKKFHTIDSAKKIVCNVLKSLDTNIKWVENSNPIRLELVPETVYNYWINAPPNFLFIKNSRENLLEEASSQSKFELKVQLSEEEFDYKYSIASNSEKSPNNVLDQMTPEFSVSDSSCQLLSDKTNFLLMPKQILSKTDSHESPEITYLESINQIPDLNDLRYAEKDEIITSSKQLPLDAPSTTTTRKMSKIDCTKFKVRNQRNQMTPEFSVSDSSCQLLSDKTNLLLMPKQILSKTDSHESPEITYLESINQIPDLNDLRYAEKDEIITSSKQLPLDAPSTTTTRKMSKIDYTKFKVRNQHNQKTTRRIYNKIKKRKSLATFTSKNRVLKTVKGREKIKKVNPKKSKKKVAAVSKKAEILPLLSHVQRRPETKNIFQRCFSRPWKAQNFQVTLKNSVQDDGSRSVIHTSQAKLAQPENIKNNSNVPEAVFQKIVLFLQSKVLLKCKGLQPHEQEEKTNHLASLFIQNNIVDKLDKKMMKLLNEFAESCI